MRKLIGLLAFVSTLSMAQQIQPVQPTYRDPIPVIPVQTNAMCRIDSLSNGQIVPIGPNKMGMGMEAQIVVTTNVDRMFQVVINPMPHRLPSGSFKVEQSARVIQGANTGQVSTDTNSDKVTIVLNQQGQAVISVEAIATSTTGALPVGSYELNYKAQCIPLN